MHYLGSPAPGRDGTYFAYGGAGFVLSRGMMEELVGDGTQLRSRYEDYAINDCCGDAVLGYAILDKTGERLQALYPTFAGDDLNGLQVDGERWCVPLLALHRVSPELMKSLWEWERTRPYDKVSGLVLSLAPRRLLINHRTPLLTRPFWTTPCPALPNPLRGLHGTTLPIVLSRKTHRRMRPLQHAARHAHLSLAVCSILIRKGGADLEDLFKWDDLRRIPILPLAGTWKRYPAWDTKKVWTKPVPAKRLLGSNLSLGTNSHLIEVSNQL